MLDPLTERSNFKGLARYMCQAYLHNLDDLAYTTTWEHLVEYYVKNATVEIIDELHKADFAENVIVSGFVEAGINYVIQKQVQTIS